MVAVTRVITTRRISFEVIVELDGNEEHGFTIHDDGWKIWIKRASDDVVDVINFGTDSERGPDFASAIQHVTAWADKRWP